MKINGVDTAVVENLVKRFQDEPKEAITPWSSTVVWQDGFHVEMAIGDHAAIAADEPQWLGGSNNGPNSVQLLLGALGVCVNNAFIAVASLSGVPVKSLETKVSGAIDLQVFLGLREGNAGFDQITVDFVVDSSGTDEQIQNIMSQAMKISPVENTVERTTKIDAHYDRVPVQ